MLKQKCQANWDWLVTLKEGKEGVPSRGGDKCKCCAGKATGPGWAGGYFLLSVHGRPPEGLLKDLSSSRWRMSWRPGQ